MDIVFDSNIFKADFNLDKPPIKAVMHYLSQTKSRMLLPEMVLREVRELFKVELHARNQSFNEASKKLGQFAPETYQHKPFTIDLESLADAYIDRIQATLKIMDSDIIPFPEKYYPNIVEKAIKKLKPFNESGQGFKDNIIWYTITDHVSHRTDKRLIFISMNIKDFAAAEKNELHSQLSKECNTLGIEVIYYNGLDSFIAEHAQKLPDIDNKLEENTELIALTDLVERTLTEQHSRLATWLLRTKGIRVSGQITFEGVGAFEYSDEYIYDLSNGEFVVQAILNASTYISFDYILEPETPEGEYIWRIGYKVIDFIIPVTATMSADKIVELSSTGEVTFSYGGDQSEYGTLIEHD